MGVAGSLQSMMSHLTLAMARVVPKKSPALVIKEIHQPSPCIALDFPPTNLALCVAMQLEHHLQLIHLLHRKA